MPHIPRTPKAYTILLSVLVLASTAILASRPSLVSRPTTLTSHFKPSVPASFSSLNHHHYHSHPPSRSSPTLKMPYDAELSHALLTVTRATLLTRRVFTSSIKGPLSKTDASPVTIGDFGAQALIISSLRQAFPHDSIIAEEESSSLYSSPTLTSEIFTLVSSTTLSLEEESLLGGPIKGETSMLSLLDMGKSPGGPSGRVWALDPIDGTKGFLRGGQYAVCLALIVDGDVKVGVLGCPNLPFSDTAPVPTAAPDPDDPNTGVLFSATLGSGATSRPLIHHSRIGQESADLAVKSIHMKDLSLAE